MERQRQKRWDKRRLRTISTHISLRDYEALRWRCEREGTTPYKLLQEAVQRYLTAGDVPG